MEKGNAILTLQFKDAHYMWVAKCNIGIMTLNPHYLWEAKMINPYIKHGTFLVKFYDRIKTIQEIDFLNLGTIFFFYKNDK
jgi:hypothetical protein